MHNKWSNSRKAYQKKPTRNEKLADANKQFDTYSKYYAYHTLSRIANNRIHMTKEKTQSIHSWPCERSSAPLPSFPARPAPMILSCKLSRHLYPSAYAPVHWAVFVLLTLEALLISRLYAARISMQNKKNEENKEKKIGTFLILRTGGSKNSKILALVPVHLVCVCYYHDIDGRKPSANFALSTRQRNWAKFNTNIDIWYSSKICSCNARIALTFLKIYIIT